MTKILVIVESPGKVKKIQAILGDKYIVMASVGHIIDLDSKKLSIDVNNNFEPEYNVLPDKGKVVAELKKAYKKSDDVLLATDEDREGEMIAWSLAYVLGNKNSKRIVFNSITKDELLKAVKSPREIDNNLVDAQKARRVLDRIVGYEISPILWKSIGASLSAGRVQSVVVRLIMDRETEIKEFFQNESQSYFKFDGKFKDAKKKDFWTVLNKESNKKTKNEKTDNDDEDKEDVEMEEKKLEEKGKLRKGQKAKIENADDARGKLKLMMKSTYKIAGIGQRESLRYPSPPFTTSTLQQESARKLGMTVKRTMTAAQKLYEGGYITYMRTDSVNLSEEALKKIEKFVVSEYGKNYHRKVNYKAKTKNTQEAHEAVRPSDMDVKSDSLEGKLSNDEVRLYSLIWKRAVASQMAPAMFDVMTIQIDISKLDDHYFSTQIENLKFPGFLKVYNIQPETPENEDEKEETWDIAIPKVGSKVDVASIIGTEEYEKPPSRYNEASLVNKLDPKNLNIGRPSTYATIINKIQERGYVRVEDIEGIKKEANIISWNGGKDIEEETKDIILGKETGKMVPTPIGTIVTNFLIKTFPDIMEYKFTSKMEDELDEVAEGSTKWYKVMDTFYKKFHPIVEKLIEKNAKNKESLLDENARVIGKHPKTKQEIVATIKRYGPVVAMCDEKKKCVYAPIKPPLTVENITLDDALKLFEYPKNLGKHEGKDVMLYKGKYGLYIKYGDISINLNGKEFNEDEDGIEKIIEYINQAKEKYLWEGKDGKTSYTIMDGKYGRFITVKDTASKMIKKKPLFIKLPEDVKIEELTLDKVKEIVAKGKETKYKSKVKKTEAKTGGAKTVKKPVTKKTSKTKTKTSVNPFSKRIVLEEVVPKKKPKTKK